MTYGMTPEGFNPKPAEAIREDIFTDWRKGDGLSQLRDAPNSRAGNTAIAFSNQLAQVWEAAAALVLSFSVAGASKQSLDNVLTGVGQARQLATSGSVELTVWTFSTDSPKPLPGGSPAAQNETGVQWDLESSVTIPVATFTADDLEPDSIEWIEESTVKATFPESTDLSSVAAGMLLIFSECLYSANNGAYLAAEVNDAEHYILFSNPRRLDALADESGSDALVSITNGIATVNAVCDTPGNYEAAEQSIRQVLGGITGWDGVTNMKKATAGFARWEDSEFRANAAENTAVAQGGTLEAVKERLMTVPGVTYVAAAEDDDPSSPTYGYSFTIVGGTDQDIVNCIGRYKGGGMPTRGTSSGTYVNSSGLDKTIFFSRVTVRYIYVEWDLETNGDYPSDGDERVLNATAGVQLKHGDNVYRMPLVGAVDAANIPGLLNAEPKFSFSASPSTSTPLTIAATEQAQFKNDGTYLTIAG